jgi:hypothetical protein
MSISDCAKELNASYDRLMSAVDDELSKGTDVTIVRKRLENTILPAMFINLVLEGKTDTTGRTRVGSDPHHAYKKPPLKPCYDPEGYPLFEHDKINKEGLESQITTILRQFLGYKKPNTETTNQCATEEEFRSDEKVHPSYLNPLDINSHAGHRLYKQTRNLMALNGITFESTLNDKKKLEINKLILFTIAKSEVMTKFRIERIKG